MDPNPNKLQLLGDVENAPYSVTAEETEAFRVRIRSAFNLFDLGGKGAVNKRDVGALIRYLGHFPSDRDLKQWLMPQLNELLRQNRSKMMQSAEAPKAIENDEDQKDGDLDAVKSQSAEKAAVALENAVDFQTFEQIMLEIMKRNLFPADDEETVLSAFKVIARHFRKKRNGGVSDSEDDDDGDEEGGGEEKKTLFKNDIVAAMAEFGDDHCLDSRELDEFLNIAITTTDRNHGKINKGQRRGNGDDDDTAAGTANEVIYYEDYVDELFLQLANHG